MKRMKGLNIICESRERNEMCLFLRLSFVFGAKHLYLLCFCFLFELKFPTPFCSKQTQKISQTKLKNNCPPISTFFPSQLSLFLFFFYPLFMDLFFFFYFLHFLYSFFVSLLTYTLFLDLILPFFFFFFLPALTQITIVFIIIKKNQEYQLLLFSLLSFRKSNKYHVW